MNVDTSLLSSVHGVGNVGATITVGITDGEDTNLVGAHAGGNIDLVVDDLKTHLSGQVGRLNSGEVDDDGIAVDGLASGEVQTELVELLVGVLVAVLAAVLKTLNRGDGTVVNGGVPGGKLLLPVGNLGSGAGFAISGLRAVDEGDDIIVQSVSLQDVGQHVGDITDHAEGLVTVLVAITPGAPEDTLAPAVFQAGGSGKHIPNTGSQHNLAGGVVLALAVSDSEGGEVTSAPGDNGVHSLVGEVGSGVLRDLLTRQRSEGSGRGTYRFGE